MSLNSKLTATADLRLPDATRAGFADKLYRLDGGHSLANDEVGLYFRRKCRAEHRILVDLLADTAESLGVTTWIRVFLNPCLNDPEGWRPCLN